MGLVKVIHGDCLIKLRLLKANSIDSLVTDPPAGIAFMGKSWDSDKGGRDAWIAWLKEVMQECLRVMKPGAHGLVWGLPRTSHWTTTALEDAGFEVRDVITHLFGSGFPKSLDVSKAIDRAAGAEREVIGENPKAKQQTGQTGTLSLSGDRNPNLFITAPSTPEAKQWQGFGTALKPASEHWILVRKPLEKGLTIAANALKWGVGGLNIDASRINGKPRTTHSDGNRKGKQELGSISFGPGLKDNFTSAAPSGRFPANLLFSHNEDCMEVGVKQIGHGGPKTTKARTRIRNNGLGLGSETMRSGASGAPDNYGAETVSAWECSEGCAVAELDRQSGNLHASGNKKLGPAGKTDKSLFGIGSIDGRASDYKDSGGASRFFYCAKASKREKNAGCEVNNHPCVKSTKLMSYLITMVTPPGGTVLDCFAGSGTTGVAAKRLGFKFIGIEKDADYVRICEARLNAEDM